MSLSDETGTPQIVRELDLPLTRAQISGSALNDSSYQHIETWNSQYPGELHIDQDIHVDEDHATVSSSYIDFDNESDFEAIAAEAPQQLFNSSGSMQEFAKRFPAEAGLSISVEYLLNHEEVVVLPLMAGIDVRRFLCETDKELGLNWDSESSATLRGLLVIDCSSRCVVTAEPDCHYEALSYVWGSITSRGGDENFKQDLHGHRLPRTVQDAINVVLVLGMRFLWVDRYCINGNEPGTKHYTISNMGVIYEAAYLTIIAASGTNGEHGLPSVSRSCQPLDEGNVPPWDGIVHTKLPYPRLEQIERSVWATRGWTYQEGLLSRRRLIFTDDWAIVHYRGEDHVRESRGIFAHINEYSRRSLTYPSDLLKAFLGVFRAYERLQPPAMHVWGVPFLLGSDGNIRQPGYGLLWRCDRHECSLQRIQELPSWTWAGWHGWSAHGTAHASLLSPFYQFGPYHWLVGTARLRERARFWAPSDISLGIMVGGQLVDISDYLRPDYRLPSGKCEEPAPILYLTGWSTTVTAFLSPNPAVCFPGRVMEGAIGTLDQNVESMYKGEPMTYGHWGCQWTAVVICWAVPGNCSPQLKTQSLLLERVEEDTFRRVGVVETDWCKLNLDEDGRMLAMGREFNRTRLRIV